MRGGAKADLPEQVSAVADHLLPVHRNLHGEVVFKMLDLVNATICCACNRGFGTTLAWTQFPKTKDAGGQPGQRVVAPLVANQSDLQANETLLGAEQLPKRTPETQTREQLEHIGE